MTPTIKKLAVNTLCEFGPILAFLTLYEIKGFKEGTIAMMVAVLLAVIILFLVEHHLPYFALLSSTSILLFGSLSLFFNHPQTFILRDTLYDLFFGILFLGSLYFKRPMLKILFGHIFALTERGWHIFTFRWGIFFLVFALFNEIIRRNFTPDDWVLFKIGFIVMAVVFGFYQLTLTSRERNEEGNRLGLRV